MTDDSVVLFGDIDMFGTPADEVVAQLRRAHPVTERDAGSSYVFDTLLLSFRRAAVPESPDDEEGRNFDSVLIAKPGYYDN